MLILTCVLNKVNSLVSGVEMLYMEHAPHAAVHIRRSYTLTSDMRFLRFLVSVGGYMNRQIVSSDNTFLICGS